MNNPPPPHPHRFPQQYRHGGAIRNDATPTNAVAVIATSQGSVPKGCPPVVVIAVVVIAVVVVVAAVVVSVFAPLLVEAARSPICQSLYTAVNTSPTAAAFTPLNMLRNQDVERRMRHRPMKPTTTIIPGLKMAMKARRALGRLFVEKAPL